MIKKCEICKNEFETRKAKLICSDECLNRKTLEKRAKSKSNKLQGEEGIDYIVCKWCGLKVGRIYGMHIKHQHPGKTLDNYRNEFPNSPIYTDKDIKNVTSACGKHMKEEKYRSMFSDMIKGDKNPNHKSKTTEQQRKETSPYSIEFYKKRYPELSLNEQNEKLQEFYNKQDDDKLRPTQLQYWLDKGYNILESNEKLKERQTTFTLEKCIIKYGEEEGTIIYNKRQIEWQKKWQKGYNDGEFNTHTFSGNQSIIAKDFFDRLILDGNLIDYHTYSNREYIRRFKLLKNKALSFDFVHRPTKVVIEFQGDMWHGNPKLFDGNDIHPFHKKPYSKTWQYDNIKKYLIEREGYKVIHVWELDYKTNPDKEIQRCLDFIKKYTL